MLCDVTLIEDISGWRVQGTPEIQMGTTWEERGRWRRRTWSITDFDRRGLRFTMTGSGVDVTFAAKKGGPGSCNVEMTVTGEPRAVARFERREGDRLERLAALW